MQTRLIALVLAVLVGTASARTLEVIEGSYETVLANVTFPASVVGTVTVRSCPTCDGRVHPVGTNTVYIGSAGTVPLAEFLDEVDALRAAGANATTAVGVYYDLETNRATRMSLHPGVLSE